MKKAVLKVLATVLALSIALSLLTGFALAASIYGDGGDSYIRSSPNLSGAQIGTLPDGAFANYLNQNSMDDRGVTWYKISYNGKTGWVSSRYTTLSGDTVGAGSYRPIYASGGDSYIRSSPSRSGSQLGLFPQGASASYLGNSAEDSRGVTWYYISYGGTTGWVSSKYTSFSGSSSGGSYYAAPSNSGTVYGAGGDSYIRSQPNLSGAQLGLFPDGASASYLGDSSMDDRGVTWYRISYNGTTGWVSSKYTSLNGYVDSGYDYGYDYNYGGGQAVYGDGGDSYIRSQPSLSGAQLGLLPEEGRAEFLDKSSVDDRGVAWYYISYNGITGWVSSKYASFDGSGYAGSNYYGGEGTVYASGGDSYIRSHPGLSAEQLGTFPDGASARYLDDHAMDERGVTWYRISYKGITGWVSSKYTYLPG